MGYNQITSIEKAARSCVLSSNMKDGVIEFIRVLERECVNPVWPAVMELIACRMEMINEIFYLGFTFIRREKPTAITHIETRSRDAKYATIEILRSHEANESNYTDVDFEGELEDCIIYDLFGELDIMAESSSAPNDIYESMRYLKSVIISYQVFHAYQKLLPKYPPLEHDVLVCEGFPEAVNLIGRIKKGRLLPV